MTARKPPATRAAARKAPAKRAAPARKAPAKRAAPARKAPAKRAAPARKQTAKRAAPARRVMRRATDGDRPYVVGLFVLVLVLLSMAWSPLRSLAAGDQRIEELTASRDQLAAEVERLEQRQEQLMDPQELEIMAREQLGLVMPGEIPYVVVTPEQDPQLRAENEQPQVEDKPWYRRLWSAVSRLWSAQPQASE